MIGSSRRCVSNRWPPGPSFEGGFQIDENSLPPKCVTFMKGGLGGMACASLAASFGLRVPGKETMRIKHAATEFNLFKNIFTLKILIFQL